MLQQSDRPMCAQQIVHALRHNHYPPLIYAVGTIRKSLTFLLRRGRLWRGTGRRYWWGGPTVAWWWVRVKAEEEGLGQIYDGTGLQEHS